MMRLTAGLPGNLLHPAVDAGWMLTGSRRYASILRNLAVRRRVSSEPFWSLSEAPLWMFASQYRTALALVNRQAGEA